MQVKRKVWVFQVISEKTEHHQIQTPEEKTSQQEVTSDNKKKYIVLDTLVVLFDWTE